MNRNRYGPGRVAACMIVDGGEATINGRRLDTEVDRVHQKPKNNRRFTAIVGGVFAALAATVALGGSASAAENGSAPQAVSADTHVVAITTGSAACCWDVPTHPPHFP